MKKHFVTFLSPGSFVSEQNTEEIESWDVDKAMKMARNIKQRHGATPYGFYFTTRERGENDFNSKQTEESNMYHLGGDVYTLEDIINRNDPRDNILISNMKCNKWDRVIENNNSWRNTQPLNKDDVVLDFTP
jgi:hypothetical protein